MTFRDSGNYSLWCATACPLPEHGLPEKNRLWPAAGKQWHAVCLPRIAKGHLDGIGVGLAAFGLLNPLLAALIHVVSELVFILNSARLLPAV